jgi:hypothetical protein
VNRCKPHTYVKTAIATPSLALRKFTERPELNSLQPLLWPLVPIEVLKMSSTDYSISTFEFFFSATCVLCCSCVTSLSLLHVKICKKVMLL